MEEMAAPLGQKCPTVEQFLFAESYRFEFHKAVNLLEQLVHHFQVHFEIPIEIRFSSTVSTAFPASDLEKIRLLGMVGQLSNGQHRIKLIDLKETLSSQHYAPLDDPTHQLERILIVVQVNFMGLAGALGPLSLPYTELITERVWRKDTTFKDFLDIFNHRLISLLYQARKTQRVGLEIEGPWQSRFAQRLFSLLGLGMPSLRDQLAFPDQALLHYTGLFVHQSRSLSALEKLLEDFFQIKVTTTPWVGQWHNLSEEEYTYLGQQNQALGETTVLGTRVWDQQGKFTLDLGPLNLKQFLNFLPTGVGFTQLSELVRFFTKDEFNFEVNLILNAEDVTESRLGQQTWLGWTSWLKTRPCLHHASVTLHTPLS